jgi:hypothetical protein
MTNNTIIDVGQIGFVRIEEVNPYSIGHYPWDDERWRTYDNDELYSEKSHRKKTDEIIEGTKEGKIIRPILVYNHADNNIVKNALAKEVHDLIDWDTVRYHRLDGFCRYMALKEMGITVIIVHAISNWCAGAQDGQSPFLNEVKG